MDLTLFLITVIIQSLHLLSIYYYLITTTTTIMFIPPIPFPLVDRAERATVGPAPRDEDDVKAGVSIPAPTKRLLIHLDKFKSSIQHKIRTCSSPDQDYPSFAGSIGSTGQSFLLSYELLIDIG